MFLIEKKKKNLAIRFDNFIVANSISVRPHISEILLAVNFNRYDETELLIRKFCLGISPESSKAPMEMLPQSLGTL